MSLAMAWVVGTLLSEALDAMFGYADEPNLSDSTWKLAILVLVMAPLIENLVLILTVEVIRIMNGKYWIHLALLAAALLAAATHSDFNLSHGLFAAILFATMAFTYIDWRELRWRDRYLLTVLQHAIANTIPFAYFVLEHWH